ncbi:MAG: indolepyruvate oxidoreductase subunit beta [Thermoplasmata archaeon]
MNILLCGVGGQGIILASQVIGASAIREGKHVVVSEIHGMAQRGGSVHTFVRIDEGDAPIPREGSVDIAVGFERIEILRYLNYIGENTTVLFNEAKIPPISVSLSKNPYLSVEDVKRKLFQITDSVVSIDAEKIATEIGSKLVINSVLLGAFCSLQHLIPKETLEEVLLSKVPEKAREINRIAFQRGEGASPLPLR